jgi:hypothetical protein
MFETKVVKKIMSNNPPPSPNIVPFLRHRGRKWYSQIGCRWQYNTAEKICENADAMFTSSYFSTAIMVTRMHICVTLCVYCVSW